MYAIVTVDQGSLESVSLREDRDEALRCGRARWRDLNGDHELTAELEDDSDFDPTWGGVARGFVMHWFDDDTDVWVEEVTA